MHRYARCTGTEETTGTSSYYIDENHSAGSEIERPQYGRRSWLGSEPSTLKIDVYIRHYALLVVLARNDDDDDMHVADFFRTKFRNIQHITCFSITKLSILRNSPVFLAGNSPLFRRSAIPKVHCADTCYSARVMFSFRVRVKVRVS